MAYVDFLSTVHKSTKRDYVARVTEFPKAEAARLAKKWDVEYWDGDRKTGYGGYRYDGRWRKVADAMVQHYGIKPGDRILDVGCGKGFILYDFTQAVPGVEVVGIDVSTVCHRARQGRGQVVPQAGQRRGIAFPRPELRPGDLASTRCTTSTATISTRPSRRLSASAASINTSASSRTARRKRRSISSTGNSPAKCFARRRSGSGGSTRPATKATIRSFISNNVLLARRSTSRGA